MDDIYKRVEAFNQIRDLPYFIATRGEQDCCCSTKALLLEEKLKALNLQCRHTLCWFKWESLNLPASVLAIQHEELPSHQFLEVLIPEKGRWAVVDPTWDSALGPSFRINEWNGVTATECAVPIERLCTPEETRSIFAACEDPKAVRDYFESQGPFLRAVNEHLANIRSKNNS